MNVCVCVSDVSAVDVYMFRNVYLRSHRVCVCAHTCGVAVLQMGFLVLCIIELKLNENKMSV